MSPENDENDRGHDHKQFKLRYHPFARAHHREGCGNDTAAAEEREKARVEREQEEREQKCFGHLKIQIKFIKMRKTLPTFIKIQNLYISFLN